MLSDPLAASPRGPPSTSSTNSVADAAGPTGSASQGGRHQRRLQPQWWTLPDPLTAPPRGAHHRHHLQARWWTLPNMPVVPPRGPATDVVFNLGDGCCWTRQQCLPGSPPSTSSSNSVVDASRPTDSTPRGPTIDVIFKIGGGCYQTSRQSLPVGPPLTSSSNLVVDAAGSTRQRSCHQRHLQTQWRTMSDMLAAPPRGATIDILFKLMGGRCRTHRQCPQGGRH
jgi:hypothetical protein